MKRHRRQEIIRPPIEQRIIRQRARRHQPYNIAPDYALGGSRVFHLLADGDLMPCRDHFPQITFDGVKRYAGHRNLVRRPLYFGW